MTFKSVTYYIIIRPLLKNQILYWLMKSVNLLQSDSYIAAIIWFLDVIAVAIKKHRVS